MVKNNKLTNLLLILSMAIFFFGAGFKLGESKNPVLKIDRPDYKITNSDKNGKVENVDFNLFWDTWNKVEQKFIDKSKVDPKKMLYGSIKGMVATLEDPYTFFLTPDENKQTKDDLGGKFEGIGAQLGLKDNRIVIIAPLKNSPAEKAGIKAGDIIKKVNDQETKGWSLPQAVSKIRGNKGTKVKLTLQRGDKDLDLTIVRDQILINSVELTYVSQKDCKSSCPKAANLKVNQFGETTNDEWNKSVRDIRNKWDKKEIKGVVLDVRDNPGGYLDSAVYLANEFIPPGKTIVKQESTTYENKEYKATRTGLLLDIPITVLINKGSASASEILAGALRDQKRAVLIGEKSFGKGSVQEALDIGEGAGLHVTVAKWILPNGDWINGKGIDPAIKIENEIKEGNTLTKDDDKQLEKAIQEVLK